MYANYVRGTLGRDQELEAEESQSCDNVSAITKSCMIGIQLPAETCTAPMILILDVALHNPMRHNLPSGVGHIIVCHGLVKEKRLNR